MTDNLPPIDYRSLLETLYGVAVAAAHPKLCLAENLPDPTIYEKIHVIAAGKAAAASAQIVEVVWHDKEINGVAIAPNIGGVSCNKIELIEAGHPVPDMRSVHGAKRALDIAQSAGKDDLLLILLSGGASASMCMPAKDISLEEKQGVITTLLNAGASIAELNTIRKHISVIKGGQLAIAGAKARSIITLAISDVVGDDPGTIGSGPTYFDETTIGNAQEIAEKYNLPEGMGFVETLSQGHALVSKLDYKLIANSQVSLNTAANLARNLGFVPTILGGHHIGDAEFYGKTQARFIEKLFNRRRNKPKLFIAGGEYTANVKGTGKGGPNQHFLLSLLHHLPKDLPLYALSADTDGQDGTGNAAGAWITPDTQKQIKQLGLDPRSYLDNADSFGFFSQIGTVIKAQPTHTNVNDFHAFLIPPIN